MGKRVQLETSVTGVQHSVEVDEDGFFYVEHTPTSVEQQILDQCAQLRGLAQNSKSAFRLAGQIPINTHTAWRREYLEKYRDTFTWPTFLAMKMNSRDNSKLRIDEGKLPTTLNRRQI